MERSILLYASIGRINKIAFAAMGMVTVLLILRVMWDFIIALLDSDTGIKEACRKSRKRIFAAIIALTVTGIIQFIQSFYI